MSRRRLEEPSHSKGRSRASSTHWPSSSSSMRPVPSAAPQRRHALFSDSTDLWDLEEEHWQEHEQEKKRKERHG